MAPVSAVQSQRSRLLTAKTLFFTMAASQVGWNKFQTNFLLSQGMSSSQIGSLKAIGLLLKFFSEPVVCIIADLTDSKLIFVGCMIIQVFTMEILRSVRPLLFSTILFVKVLRTITAPSSTLTTAASFRLTEGTNEGYGKQRLFGSLAWGLGALSTGILIDKLGMNGLFLYTYVLNFFSLLSVSIGLPSKATGSKHDTVGNDSKLTELSHIGKLSEDDLANAEPLLLNSSPPPSPISSSSLMSSSSSSIAPSLSSSSSLLLPSSSSSSSSSPKKDSCSSTISKNLRGYMAELKAFLSHPACSALLLNSLLFGISMCSTETFLFISLEKDFLASRTFSGLMTTVSIFSCIPIFYYSDFIMKKYGHFNMIFLAEMAGIVRLLAYSCVSPSFASAKSILLCIQLIHGLTFALFWTAIVDAIYKFAPQECVSSSMAVLNVSYHTLGGAVGNFVWGKTYDTSGVYSVYRLSAIVLMIAIAIFTRSQSLITNALHERSNNLDRGT